MILSFRIFFKLYQQANAIVSEKYERHSNIEKKTGFSLTNKIYLFFLLFDVEDFGEWTQQPAILWQKTRDVKSSKKAFG